ncbi:putative transcriptional regulatory protein, AraC/XylS family [Bradyrhizobium sp. ORS 375]|uniref:AraC family transcriptional regulator n=1 Tax=Bradyrhizobium sp. (strain ORS 375) TaxID=566679 RepID=UPI00024062BA|nr:AraC family transcriptional regulator [Bradyrhizobium sp. ORS 375]CCD90681.1 putative transcriptional regulatory protein, AraC/XylS family [Bradyrhizobium sp. ORS 375]
MRVFSYLDRYPLFRSRDSEFVRDRLISVYGIDRFESHDATFGIEANLAQLTATGLAFCSYDGATSLSFPESTIVRQFFSIRGTAGYRMGSADHTIAAWSPIVSGHSRLDLSFPAGYRQLVLRIEVAPLQSLLRAILGDDTDRDLSFEDDDPDPAVMAFVRQDVFKVADELQRFGSNYSALAIAELERSLMTRLLLAHRHNFSDRLHIAPRRVNRAVVDIVESYIEAHWDEPLDMARIAGLAGVSVRSIFREFSETGRGTPGQFAKRVRLRRAAELLGTPDDNTSVVSVAFRCGFGNLGRFASDYRGEMGELPSETLRKARTRQGHRATDDPDQL